MSPVETLLRQLPPVLRQEAEDFIVFLARRNESTARHGSKQPSWAAFVDEMFGCMSDAPIRREAQGQTEIRQPLT